MGVLHMQILGTPTEDTWPGIKKNSEFVNYQFPKFHADPLGTHAPRLSTDGINLLEKLLHFESKNRTPALEAMRHPYFEPLGPRVYELPNSELELLNTRRIVTSNASILCNVLYLCPSLLSPYV